MHGEVSLEQAATDVPVNRLTQLRTKTRPGFKRGFDLGLTTLLLVVVLPLVSLIILFIVMSGQPPFYSHRRVGRGGQEFACLKFRTMHCNADVALAQLLQQDPIARAEWEKNYKLRKDPRVTRLGHALRTTSLDELPQLLNILMGHMSLVGPRPVTSDELVKYYGPSEAAAYFSVRPGLTGLWQVSGRGEAGYNNRVALDTLYAQHLSIRSDISILLRTVGVVARQRGAW